MVLCKTYPWELTVAGADTDNNLELLDERCLLRTFSLSSVQVSCRFLGILVMFDVSSDSQLSISVPASSKSCDLSSLSLELGSNVGASPFEPKIFEHLPLVLDVG